MWKPRFRSTILVGGALLALAASLLTDPDSGLSTALGGLALVQGIWAVAIALVARKALMDYPEADWRRLFAKAAETPTGAGLALLAGAVITLGLLLVFSPRAHADPLPTGFLTYGSALKAEQARLWPTHPKPALLAALVEQESCLSLTHSRCWNPGARLKSAREEGAGMGQITRAYRADGSLRFDTLAELQGRYGAELGGLTWANVYQRPELQLRALVLLARDSTAPFRQAPAALEFGDAGYNGGVAGVQKERRACQLATGCDPGQWFGHVELHCLKSRAPLYGQRSACDINREHVHQVLQVRWRKYQGWV